MIEALSIFVFIVAILIGTVAITFVVFFVIQLFKDINDFDKTIKENYEE